MGSDQMTVAVECLVQALDELVEVFRGWLGLIGVASWSSGGRGGRGGAVGQDVGQVQRRQHRDALAGLELAAVADGAHFAVDLRHGFAQTLFTAVRAAQQIALPHDGNFNLLHGDQVLGRSSSGSASIEPAT